MASTVEWIEERHVQWLGQLAPTTAAAAATSDEVESLKEELRREQNRLTTTDKVLIASLILSVVSFAWGVYTSTALYHRGLPR